jgi:glycosyltransferase involved in cell wall biosynthesis
MRVLHLTTELPPVIYGGLGTAVGGLVNATARAGMTVGVLLLGQTGLDSYRHPVDTMRGAPIPLSTAHFPGVALFSLPWPDALEGAVEIARQWRPDVIHLHAFWAWPVACALQERLGIPVVYTVHSLDRAEYELGEGPPECLAQAQTQEAAISAAQRVVALSESERDLLARYCPQARDRVRVVGNGIDDDDRARAVAQGPRSSLFPTVLFSGRFVERKGIHELLAAIPWVLEAVPGTRFVLAGGHRHCSGLDMGRRWLPAALHRYRLRVHFTGWLTPEAMARWYGAADILVVPSWYEPFGMVVLEGMLHGLPVAAAAVGGPAEILEHGRTGLLFPPRNAEALSHTLVQLVESRRLRQQMGAAAADEVRRLWLWPHLVGKMRIVYQEAIRLGTGPA